MSFSLATFLSKLVPNQHELLEEEIARTEAELETVSNKLQRLVQLSQLNKDTEAAREALNNLATEVAAQNECHEQIFASIEDLKGRLAKAA
jgi:predicted  nucleic acid-binding Zn-ribbon protein